MKYLVGLLFLTSALFLVASPCLCAFTENEGPYSDLHGRRARCEISNPQLPPGDGSPQTTSFPNWVTLGPFGGDVEDVNASPADANIVLAGIAPDSSVGYISRAQGTGTTVNMQIAAYGTVDNPERRPRASADRPAAESGFLVGQGLYPGYQQWHVCW